MHHRVGAPRLHWRYLVTRCFAEGESKSAVARLVGRRKALSTERSYAARILPSALWRELRVAARGRSGGLVGAAAIVVAPLAAAGGYVTDRARAAPRRLVGGRSSPPSAPRLVDEPHPATES